MDYLILAGIGLLMGLFGGLLGIGGSVVMIPALVLVWGENQHLYQASAMICNFFVTAAATVAHRNANMIISDIVRLLAPSAAGGVVLGVLLSNSSLFAASHSYLLARLFGSSLRPISSSYLFVLSLRPMSRSAPGEAS